MTAGSVRPPFILLGSSVSAASPKAWASATIAYSSIVVRNGSTTGVCDWNQPAGPVLAKCTFGTGTGRLTQFSLAVDVAFDGTYWHWDRWYWFGGGD